MVADLTITKDFAVRREYSGNRIYYKVNVEAMRVYANMIKDLGLDQLDENKLILELLGKVSF
jgi:hypothetical protein